MASAQLELMTLRKKHEKLQHDYYFAKGITIQQCIDVAEITLHLHYGFGPDRNREFEEKFKRLLYEVMEMALSETEGNSKKDKNNISFTKEMLDKGLRQAMGDDILPFDARYAEGRLYERVRELGR